MATQRSGVPGCTCQFRWGMDSRGQQALAVLVVRRCRRCRDASGRRQSTDAGSSPGPSADASRDPSTDVALEALLDKISAERLHGSGHRPDGHRLWTPGSPRLVEQPLWTPGSPSPSDRTVLRDPDEWQKAMARDMAGRLNLRIWDGIIAQWQPEHCQGLAGVANGIGAFPRELRDSGADAFAKGFDLFDPTGLFSDALLEAFGYLAVHTFAMHFLGPFPMIARLIRIFGAVLCLSSDSLDDCACVAGLAREATGIALETMAVEAVRWPAEVPEPGRPVAGPPEAERPEAERPQVDRPKADRPKADRPERSPDRGEVGGGVTGTAPGPERSGERVLPRSPVSRPAKPERKRDGEPATSPWGDRRRHGRSAARGGGDGGTNQGGGYSGGGGGGGYSGRGEGGGGPAGGGGGGSSAGGGGGGGGFNGGGEHGGTGGGGAGGGGGRGGGRGGAVHAASAAAAAAGGTSGAGTAGGTLFGRSD
jgi:hypothetical protein